MVCLISLNYNLLSNVYNTRIKVKPFINLRHFCPQKYFISMRQYINKSENKSKIKIHVMLQVQKVIDRATLDKNSLIFD